MLSELKETEEDPFSKMLVRTLEFKKIKIKDLNSGKTYTGPDIKKLYAENGKLHFDLCDKELIVTLDEELLECLTTEEISWIQIELEMEFPYLKISFEEGAEYGVRTRGLTEAEQDRVSYNLRPLFENAIEKVMEKQDEA